MQYKVCDRCGAHLDFGEICDCRETEKEAAPLHRERPRANDYPLSVYQPSRQKSRMEGVRPWQKS